MDEDRLVEAGAPRLVEEGASEVAAFPGRGAGGGKMINAPQSGYVVKYQTVSRSAFTGARRL